MNDSFVAKVNRIAVRGAFLAIALGIVAAVLAIWMPDGGALQTGMMRLMGTSVVLFIGCASALAIVKFFYVNRDREK
jgi:membrane protein implicated in regulation of membrane protease activity